MSLDPPPRDKLIEFTRDGKPTWNIASRWLDWLLNRDDTIASASLQLERVNKPDQSAAIGATPINTGSLSSRRIRVTYFLRVVQAAGVSSSVIPTIAFTDGGINCAFVGADLNGNTTASVQTGSFFVRCDAGTNLTYAIAYASVGAPVAKYDLEVIAESLN